jgi:hypothetical protein
MKANELRIGNFIYNDRNEIFKVNWITKIIESQSTAIPLTEEWLLNFGFELLFENKDSGFKKYAVNKKGFDIMFSIECNCITECYLENIGIDIEHVHQLQNLYFALTGEEATYGGNK